MSNSSDRISPDAAMVLLLDAIGREWHVIGSEILKLGESLSAATAAPLDIVQMQSFDALAQNALAQSRLIAGLSQSMGDKVDPRATLCALIEDVPFLSVRERLRAAMGHAASAAEETSSDGMVTLWRTSASDSQANTP